MDLKSILEQENHSVNTSLFGYDFYISPERNIYNVIRNKYKKLAVSAKEKFAKMNDELTDINDLLNSVPSAFVVSIEEALLEILQDIISVDIYTIDKEAVIEMAFNGEYFNEFSKSFAVFNEKVNAILKEVNDEAYAREIRKESRPRWTSATFGGNMFDAWENELEAVGMNLIEGAAHSVVNAIGNSITKKWAEGEMSKLFNSQNLRQDMIDSVYTSCFNLHLLLLEIVKTHSSIEIGGTVSEIDEQKAQAMFNNFTAINLDEEKRAKFINDIFSLNPYQRDFYKVLTKKFGDKTQEFDKFSDFFGINIFEIKNEILVDFVNENLGQTEEDAYCCKEKMEELSSVIGLDVTQILQANAIIKQRLEELDLIYRTVEGIVFETREEADLAREELKEIQAIMSTIIAPTKDSTLSYENELLSKKDKVDSFKIAIKNKYLAEIDNYLKEFDKKFRNESFLSSGMTREEAGNQRALQYAKTLPVNSYDELDKARTTLLEFLPEVGITSEQATAANEYFERCENQLNTIDGVLFNSREEAAFGKQELAQITEIMESVAPPTKDSLLSYEKHLFETLELLKPFQTDIKNKYIKLVNDYIQKFDVLFKQISMFKQAETREEAAQDKALKLVKTIAPNTCGYADVDKATQELTNILPEIGIDISQAFAATQYIKSQEDRLNTVDGVVMSSREETQIAKTELSQIQGIMSKIVPPTSESLLDYETELLQYKTEVEKFTTAIKNKYLGIIQKYLTDFDEKFRRVSLIKICATREEAARERALKFVKSKTYNILADVENARNELLQLLPKLGISIEQATEATTFLTNNENRINGVSTGSKFGDFMNKFKK